MHSFSILFIFISFYKKQRSALHPVCRPTTRCFYFVVQETVMWAICYVFSINWGTYKVKERILFRTTDL